MASVGGDIVGCAEDDGAAIQQAGVERGLHGVAVEVAGELAEGETVAQRDGREVEIGLCAGVGCWALHSETAQRVGPVEDYDWHMGSRTGLEKVAGKGFVGPEADAGVREIDEDDVDLAEVGLFGVLVGGFWAVDGDDRKMCDWVGFRGEVLGVLGGTEAVLGGEEGGEGQVGGGVGEDVNGAGAVGVDAGLIGEEADAKRSVRGVG